MSEHIADTPQGQLNYTKGELINRGKVWRNGLADPVAYRGSMPANSIGTRVLVKHSGDVERADGTQDECVLRQFKLDERYPQSALVGQITTHLRMPGSNEAGKLVETVSWDGIQYHVPIIGAGGGDGESNWVFSADRAFIWNYQDDGHQVEYQTHGSQNNADGRWEPVWSNWHGLLKPLPWV